jgi:tetratricopeptide (TPR) repeat protein
MGKQCIILFTDKLLAEMYRMEGRYKDAQPFYARARQALEKASEYAWDALIHARCSFGLAEIYRHAEKYSEAEALYKEALKYQDEFIPDQQPIEETLFGLAEAYRGQGSLEKADELYTEAQQIRVKYSGPYDPLVAQILGQHSIVLEKLGRKDEAKKKRALAAEVREKISKQTVK